MEQNEPELTEVLWELFEEAGRFTAETTILLLVSTFGLLYLSIHLFRHFALGTQYGPYEAAAIHSVAAILIVVPLLAIATITAYRRLD